MKILYLCSDYGIPVLGRKGASVHIREISAAFTRAGHSVVVVSPLANKSPWENNESIDAKFLQLPLNEILSESIIALRSYTDQLNQAESLPGEIRRILYNVDIEPRLILKFKNNPPDLIYVRAALYSTVGVQLARELNKPLFVELNAPLALEQSTYRDNNLGGLALEAERALLKNANAVFSVSSQLSRHAIELGVNPDRAYVLPNGVNTAHFYPKPPSTELKKKYNLDKEPVLGFVGGLRPWHGVQCLPELLSDMIKIDSRTKMMLVGDGPLKSTLMKAFEEKNLLENVIFTGSQSYQDIPDLIRLFTVALAPYPKMDHDFYFSPLKLFEYMACGIPVVAANTGQISTIIRDQENGFLYCPGDKQALLNACKKIIEDNNLAQYIGGQAVKEIHDNYTWDINVSKIIDVAKLN